MISLWNWLKIKIVTFIRNSYSSHTFSGAVTHKLFFKGLRSTITIFVLQIWTFFIWCENNYVTIVRNKELISPTPITMVECDVTKLEMCSQSHCKWLTISISESALFMFRSRLLDWTFERVSKGLHFERMVL